MHELGVISALTKMSAVSVRGEIDVFGFSAFDQSISGIVRTTRTEVYVPVPVGDVLTGVVGLFITHVIHIPVYEVYYCMFDMYQNVCIYSGVPDIMYNSYVYTRYYV